jgi:UDP-N-acetylmuramoylalanine--D-glutamate ligase
VKRALVYGLARSGAAAAAALERDGVEVVQVDATLGNEDDLSLLDGIDVLVKNPGVPGERRLVEEARRRRIPVWSEVELGYRLLRPRPFVGVTGTKGKTTTCELLGAIFRAAGREVIVAGNVGRPLSAVDAAEDAWVVCELSSFQLEDVHELALEVAVFLNLEPDHLDRHGTFERYRDAKLRIFERAAHKVAPRDFVAQSHKPTGVGTAEPIAPAPKEQVAQSHKPTGVGAAEPIAPAPKEQVAQSHKPTGVGTAEPIAPAPKEQVAQSHKLGQGWIGFGADDPLPAEPLIPGRHNRENAAAAAAAARAVGIGDDAIAEALRTFPGVPHRLELVRELGGVRWINDSIATNTFAVRRGVEAFDAPVRLILGGRAKGEDFEPFARDLPKNVRSIYLVGEATDELAAALDTAGREYTRAQALARAVELAAVEAEPGDVVLLSPACASYDQYADFEERGEDFRRLAANLR